MDYAGVVTFNGTPGIPSPLPLTGEVGWGHINVEGYIEAPGQELQVDMRGASPNYYVGLCQRLWQKRRIVTGIVTQIVSNSGKESSKTF